MRSPAQVTEVKIFVSATHVTLNESDTSESITWLYFKCEVLFAGIFLGFWIHTFMKPGKYTLLAQNPYGKEQNETLLL